MRYVFPKRSFMEYCPPLFCGTTSVPRIAENPALKSSKLDISPKQKVRSNQTTQICSETKFMEICLYLLYGRTPAFFGNQNKDFLCQSFVTITSQRIAAWEQRVHDHDVNRLQKQPGSLLRSKTLARAVKEKVWSKVETGNFSRHKRLVPCKTDFEKKECFADCSPPL